MKKKCEQDVEDLKKESQNVSDLIKLIKEKAEIKNIIYICVPCGNDEREKKMRNDSKQKLLNHLETTCRSSFYENHDKNYYLNFVETIMEWSKSRKYSERKEAKLKKKAESVKLNVKLKEITNENKMKDKQDKIKSASLKAVIEITNAYTYK